MIRFYDHKYDPIFLKTFASQILCMKYPIQIEFFEYEKEMRRSWSQSNSNTKCLSKVYINRRALLYNRLYELKKFNNSYASHTHTHTLMMVMILFVSFLTTIKIHIFMSAAPRSVLLLNNFMLRTWIINLPSLALSLFDWSVVVMFASCCCCFPLPQSQKCCRDQRWWLCSVSADGRSLRNYKRSLTLEWPSQAFCFIWFLNGISIKWYLKLLSKSVWL